MTGETIKTVIGLAGELRAAYCCHVGDGGQPPLATQVKNEPNATSPVPDIDEYTAFIDDDGEIALWCDESKTGEYTRGRLTVDAAERLRDELTELVNRARRA